MQVRFLDWDRLSDPEDPEMGWIHSPSERTSYDVLLASDVIFSAESAVRVVECIKALVKPGGTAYVCTATSRSRFGVDNFVPSLRSQGLEFAQQPVDACDAAVLLAADQMLEFEMYSVGV